MSKEKNKQINKKGKENGHNGGGCSAKWIKNENTLIEETIMVMEEATMVANMAKMEEAEATITTIIMGEEVMTTMGDVENKVTTMDTTTSIS